MNDPLLNPVIYSPTLEQQFTLTKMQGALPRIKEQEKDKMIMDAMRLIMVKDNMIKAMMKKYL